MLWLLQCVLGLIYFEVVYLLLVNIAVWLRILNAVIARTDARGDRRSGSLEKPRCDIAFYRQVIEYFHLTVLLLPHRYLLCNVGFSLSSLPILHVLHNTGTSGNGILLGWWSDCL